MPCLWTKILLKQIILTHNSSRLPLAMSPHGTSKLGRLCNRKITIIFIQSRKLSVMTNSPNQPDPDSSNQPDPDSSNEANKLSLSNLFRKIIDSPIDKLISNTFFAHYFNTHPFIANLSIFLIMLLSGGNLYQILTSNKIFELNLQNQVCQNNQQLIKEQLETEKKSSKTNILQQVKVDNNSNMDFLPFHCEYSIELDNEKSFQQIYLRPSPVFGEYINEDYKNNGSKMNMPEVCKHPSMKKQMIDAAKKNSSYDEKNGDIIKQGKPELLKGKTYAYPVHRWVCHYSIQKQVKGVQPVPDLGGTSDFTIDLNLKDYCLKKSKDEGTNFKEPHYHDYDNPYSFYCTDPYSHFNSQ